MVVIFDANSKLSYLLMFHPQVESAMTLIFDWLEGTTMWEGWRFVLMEFGAQCVMTFGITGMQQWCVDNWDTQGVSSLSRTYLLVYSTMMYIQGLVSRVIASRMTTMQGLKLGASSVQKVGLVATSIFNAISGFCKLFRAQCSAAICGCYTA